MKINFQPKYILIFFALFLACVFGAGGAQAATTTGTFESSVINLGNKVNFTTLSWTASIPAGCPTCGVKFELAVSNDNFTSGTYYTGLSGPGTFYTTSGSTIHTNLNGNQYIKYRATLYTDDTNYSASLSDVSIGYTQYPVLASLESSPFDTKRTYRALQKISWSESGVSGAQDVKFQLRTASTQAGLTTATWLGPAGSASYYTDPTGGETVNSLQTTGGDDQWVQYKVFLTSAGGNTITPPTLSSVTLSYYDTIVPVFESNVINFGKSVTLGTISWSATVPSQTQTSCAVNTGDGCALKFQVAASADCSVWGNYVGPQNNPAYYFTVSGESLPVELANSQCFQYKAFLDSNDPAYSPSVSSVSFDCASCSNPETVESSVFDSTDTKNTLESVQFTNTNTANLTGAVKLQFSTSFDKITWTPWCGPDDGVAGSCSQTTYFTGPADIFDDTMKDGIDDRYFKYKMILEKDAGGYPSISKVITTYSHFGANSKLTQSAYRWFLNADSLIPGTPMTIQDTAETLTADDQSFRLRILLHVSNVDTLTETNFLKLQFAAKSGTCDTGFVGENYKDLTASTDIAYSDNISVFDGASLLGSTTTNDPTHSPDAVIPQSYEEANDISISAPMSVGQDGLWDISLKNNFAPTNTAYCFRIVKQNGSLLSSYNVVPEINTRVEVASNFNFKQALWNALSTTSIRTHSAEMLSPGTWSDYRVIDTRIVNGGSLTIAPVNGSIINDVDADFLGTHVGTEVFNGSIRLKSGL